MTDISAYFHQVLIDERDADVFRYFWFADQSMETYKTLRFNAHIFGSGASSLVTSFILRYHAERIKSLFPQNVYDTIKNKIYVDDGSGGADTIEEALRLKEDLKTALKMGGFDLAKWKSILLANVDTKAYHSCLRENLLSHAHPSFHDSQCGGIPHRACDHTIQ